MAAAMARPVNAIGRIEGAFNRCIMRVAQALKDPSAYGDCTKPLIQECALQFHDALDDCEVQILDAKWYLEHQLAQNKARREAKAREEGLVAQKRKLDQIQDKGEAETQGDDVKRVRLEAPREKTAVKTAETTVEQPDTNEEEPTTVPQPPKSDHEDIPPKPADEHSKPEHKLPITPSKPLVEPAIQRSKPIPQVRPPAQPPPVTTATDQPASATTEAQPTPQVTPALTNDEFNFVSMFQEPLQDVANLDGTNNDDLNFNLDLGDNFARAVSDRGGGIGGEASQGGALGGLLPGLENYVQETEGDAGGGASNLGAPNSNSNQDMNFDLPPLDGPNEFDALFNEQGFDGMGTVSGGLDIDPDGTFSHEALNMENLDLDSMFN